MNFWFWVLGWYSLASAATLVLFAWDKMAAKRRSRRVPERTLHALELIGGWPGALVGIFWLRHKSSKRRFLVVTCAIMALHLGAWGAWAAWNFG